MVILKNGEEMFMKEGHTWVQEKIEKLMGKDTVARVCLTNRCLPLISFNDAVSCNKILAADLSPITEPYLIEANPMAHLVPGNSELSANPVPEGSKANASAPENAAPQSARGAVVICLQDYKHIPEGELDNPLAQGGRLHTTVSKILEKVLALCNTKAGRIDIMTSTEEYAKKVRDLLEINREIASLSKEDRKGAEGTRLRSRREGIASRLQAVPIKVDVGTRQQAEKVAKECTREKLRHLGELIDIQLYVKDSGSYCRNCLENNCKGCGKKDCQKCRHCGCAATSSQKDATRKRHAATVKPREGHMATG